MHYRKSFVSLTLLLLVSTSSHGDDWHQWRGKNRDGVWNETNLVDKFDADSLNTVWRQPLGSGYTGPTVANGRLFVMDRQTKPDQKERVLCFDSKTGKPIWDFAYSATYKSVGYVAGPRASVSIDQDKVYTLGTMGHLHCLSANKGEVIWKHDLDQEYGIVKDKRMPIWEFRPAPWFMENS